MADPEGAVLVIGYGNPQRGDDGVAWKVLDSLDDGTSRAGALLLQLERVHQLVPELAEAASRAQGVIFVDARADREPGDVSCEAVGPGVGDAALAHVLSPQTVLLYAERLFGQAPRAALVTVAGSAFGHGVAISPAVRRAIPRAARRIQALARLWMQRPRGRAVGA